MHRLITTPSVGGVLRKIMALNPDLSAQDMIQIIKMSVERRDMGANSGFSKLEVVNEAKALELTRETLKK